jgi:glyoxylate reductase
VKIVVTRALPAVALEPLHRLGEVWVSPHDRPLRPDELAAAVPGAHGIVTMLTDDITEAVLTAAGDQLAVVANTAVGFDNLDLAAIAGHGAVATNTPGVLVDATADMAMALLLAVTRRLSEGDRLVRSGTPWSWDVGFLLGSGLQGKRLGIVGMGSIGRAVAARAQAFGMEIVYCARRTPGDRPIGTRVDFEELIAGADVVSLHCPLTRDTRHLIDGAVLRQMKTGAYLINTARGPIVDEAALIAALEDRTIAGAGLDVYEFEPDVPARLRALPNVVPAPHLGSATIETRTQMARLAVDNVVAVLSGKEAVTPIAVTSH